MAMRTRIRFLDEEEDRPEKPRLYGLTEIRGPTSALMDGNCLQDILEMIGPFVDGLKFDGGSYSLMPETFIKEITDIAHRHNVNVGTGDWADHLLQKGPCAFREYVKDCKNLGFDIINVNGDSLVPEENLLRLIRIIKSEKLKVKPQFGIQFEASAIPSNKDRLFGAYVIPTEQKEMIEDVDILIRKAERCLDAGADMIMIDAEGISNCAEFLRTDAIAKIIGRLGLEKTMFEAGTPDMLEWFVGRYGSRHKQIDVYIICKRPDRKQTHLQFRLGLANIWRGYTNVMFACLKRSRSPVQLSAGTYANRICQLTIIGEKDCHGFLKASSFLIVSIVT